MSSIPTGLKSLDVLKINNAEPLVGVIDDAIKHVPELLFYDASPITRNKYNTLVVTKDPMVGFRKPGEFASHESAKLELRTVECSYLDASWKVDKALAQQSDWGKETVFAIETLTHLRSAFMMLARQIYYGNKSNPEGFRGLFELIGSTNSDRSNADLHIDARTFPGGNTDTGSGVGLSSVYAVSTGIDSIQLAWGSEGKLTEGDVGSTLVTNPENPKNSGAYYYEQEIAGWCGLQVTSAHAFGRINSLSEANKLTDTMLFELISRFPIGRAPQAFFMNRRTLNHLRESRIAFHPTGAPVDTPDKVGGIPIIVTDAIANNEETFLS